MPVLFVLEILVNVLIVKNVKCELSGGSNRVIAIVFAFVFVSVFASVFASVLHLVV